MQNKDVIEMVRGYLSAGLSLQEIIFACESAGIYRCRRTWEKYLEQALEKPPDPLETAAAFAFAQEPFSSTVITILQRANPKHKLYASAIYEVLYEKYVEAEDSEYTALPGSERSLRRYLNYLKMNGIASAPTGNGRVYDHVFETDPGEKMEIDFGEFLLADKTAFHFIVLLLMYSRYMIVIGQDHKFSSEEACRAIYTGFMRLGGAVKELVIDQDSVFVVKESKGEYNLTETFGAFVSEQHLKLFVCRKADPEAKGGVENAVGFVKKRFLSARVNSNIPDILKALPGWLERANNRIHQGIFCVPLDIFRRFEQPEMKPLLPSMYNNIPSSYTAIQLTGYPYVTYKTNKYFFPSALAFSLVYYRVINGKIYLYNSAMRCVAEYPVSPLKGHSFQHEGFANEPHEWEETVRRMRQRWDCHDFKHFVNGIKKENPRYINEQLRGIEDFLIQQNADKRTVSKLMNYCCENFRYKLTQVQDSYLRLFGDSASKVVVRGLDVGTRPLAAYQTAFEKMTKE